MQQFTTLISAEQLQKNLNQPNWVIVDCRFSLADKQEGQRDFYKSHIPNAVYAHLDKDLSGEIIAGKTGRHPLPTVEKISNLLGYWGIDSNTQVIAYDQGHGGISARLWWMLHWLGHEKVAVLEGGWKAWQSGNFPTTNNIRIKPTRKFVPQLQENWTVDAEWVNQIRQNKNYRLVDSRAAERYRGEVEPIDPIAGHIEGAISAPFAENLNSEGTFLSKEALQKRFNKILQQTPSENAVFYCGSGVTACHNLLAMRHAGLPMAKLYAGSWSDWITNL